MIGSAAIIAGVPTSAASPSDSNAGMPACANGPSSADEAVDRRRLRAEVGEHGRRLVGERAEPLHRRAQLAQERGQALDVGLEVVAALGGRLGHLGRVLQRRGDPLALARQRRQHRVAVDGERCERLVLRGEDLEDLVDLLERRVGAADDLVEVVAAAGDARAELVEDDRQPRAAAGSRVMLLIRSRSTGLVVCETGSRYWPSPLPVVDLLQRGRRLGVRLARLRRLALDELLADQRLRAGSMHSASRRKSW